LNEHLADHAILLIMSANVKIPATASRMTDIPGNGTAKQQKHPQEGRPEASC
jgi:hypothetical protein